MIWSWYIATTFAVAWHLPLPMWLEFKCSTKSNSDGNLGNHLSIFAPLSFIISSLSPDPRTGKWDVIIAGDGPLKIQLFAKWKSIPTYTYIYIYIYIYINFRILILTTESFVCVRVCVCERERDRQTDRDRELWTLHSISMCESSIVQLKCEPMHYPQRWLIYSVDVLWRISEFLKMCRKIEHWNTVFPTLKSVCVTKVRNPSLLSYSPTAGSWGEKKCSYFFSSGKLIETASSRIWTRLNDSIFLRTFP